MQAFIIKEDYSKKRNLIISFAQIYTSGTRGRTENYLKKSLIMQGR